METPVVFSSAGQQIMGVLHTPEGDTAGLRPAVVFFHGFTGHKSEVRRMFVRTARGLANKGIASLRFDFRGSGDSEGEFSDMRINGLFADAFTAIDYIRSVPGVDPSRIAVVGFSLGGLIASQVLAKEQDLRGVVLWSPVATPGELLDDVGQGKGNVDLGGWLVSRAFVNGYAKVRPLESFKNKKINTPVYILHGSEDEAVPIEHGYEYEQVLSAAGAKVSLHVIEGAGHTFESVELDRAVVSQTVRWLAKTLSR